MKINSMKFITVFNFLVLGRVSCSLLFASASVCVCVFAIACSPLPPTVLSIEFFLCISFQAMGYLVSHRGRTYDEIRESARRRERETPLSTSNRRGNEEEDWRQQRSQPQQDGEYD